MTNRRSLRVLLAVLVLAVAASGALAVEQTQILVPDGTLYVATSGRAMDLGVSGNGIEADNNVITWSSRKQDGSQAKGIVSGTNSPYRKRNLDLAYDETSGSLLLLWNEDLSVLNVLRLGVFRDGVWNTADLLPNLGFSLAYNAKMLLLRQTVHYEDFAGKDVWRVRSILLVTWFEDGSRSQARLATIFLNEDPSTDEVPVYDLPALIGAAAGPAPSGAFPASAYMYPSLRHAPGGAALANFADVYAGKEYVVRISFPDDLGKQSPTNPAPLRRRIPVVGVTSESPLPLELVAPAGAAVSTVISPTFNPTHLWRDGDTVRYLRFDGKKWSSVKSIALTAEMSYEKAMRLVEEMATKN